MNAQRCVPGLALTLGLATASLSLRATQYWTADWEIIPSETISRPSVASWEPGRLDLFWRGSDNHLKHRWVPYFGGWSWEQDLGGTVAGAPTAVSSELNSIDVFWRGPDNHLYWIFYPDTLGDWSIPEDLSQSWAAADLLTSDPAVCALGPGVMGVFWRGIGDSLKRIAKLPGQNWTPVDEVSGPQLAGAPAAVSWGQDRFDLFWRDPANHLRHTWYDPFNGGWPPAAEDLGTVSTSELADPAVSSWGVGRLDVFWRGEEGQLLHRRFSQTTWSGTENLGGYLESAPGCVAWSNARIDVFARSSLPETPLQHKAWKSGPFHDFAPGVIRTVVTDQTMVTHSYLWEYSCAVQPPVSGDPANPARLFLSGSRVCGGVGCSVLYSADLVQDSLSAATDIFQDQIQSALLTPEENGAIMLTNACDRGSPLYSRKLGSEADNIMTMFPNGNLMLVRGLSTSRQRSAWPGSENVRSGNMIFTLPLGEADWQRKTDIDNADIDFDNGFWDTPGCNGFSGFDLEKVYADPWSIRVFVTENCAADDPRVNTDFLFFSDDSGQVWNYRKIAVVRNQPYLMTSLPGAFFLLSAVRLYWSWDLGYTLSPAPTTQDVRGGAPILWTDPSVPQTELVWDGVVPRKDGSLHVTRVGQYYYNGQLFHVVRVGYRSNKRDAQNVERQVFRIVAVHIPDQAHAASQVTVQNLRTIEAKNAQGQLAGDITGVVMVEPIGATPYYNDYNTALIYWREELPQAGGGTNTTIKGQFITGLHGWSRVLTLSTYSDGTPRSFPGSFRPAVTGDYAQGAYYYDEASQEARYVAQWIEAPGSPTPMSLHVAILGIPKRSRAYFQEALAPNGLLTLFRPTPEELQLVWDDCFLVDCCPGCPGPPLAPVSQPEVTFDLNPPITWTPLTEEIVERNGQFTISTRLPSLRRSAFFRLARRVPLPAIEAQLLISASAGPNGTVSPSGTVLRHPGESATFTAIPDVGFQVDLWQVDGTVVQRGADRLELSDISSDQEVRVSFRQMVDYDLAIEAVSQPLPVPVNSNLTFRFSVLNLGLRSVERVQFIDRLPEGLRFVAAETSLGTGCEPSDGTITCELGPLDPGASVLVTLVVVPVVEGTFTNVATVEGYVEEADFRNNTSTVTAGTRSSEFLVLAEAASRGAIRPEGSLLISPGGDQTFNAEPQEGFAVDAWYVDRAIAQTGGDTFTLRNVSADHTITVSFVQDYEEH